MFYLVFRRMHAHVKESRTHMHDLADVMLRREEKKKQDNNKVVILYWERLCVRTMAECRDAGQMAELAGAAGRRSPATGHRVAAGTRAAAPMVHRSTSQHSNLNVSVV
jgi:hypothetical protein